MKDYKRDYRLEVYSIILNNNEEFKLDEQTNKYKMEEPTIKLLS